jgi:putative nucleotidyltransferase with HDIG domain
LSELSSVYEIGVGLSISEDLDGFLEKMYRRTCSITGAKTFYVALHSEGDSFVRFEIEYCEGIRIPKKSLKLSDTDGFTRWILKNNNPILRKDLKKDVDRYPMEPTNYGLEMQSYLGVPIRFKDKVIGVLSFQSPKSNLFDESTTSLFTAFANQLGVVIANKRLFTEMDVVLKKLEKSYNVTLRSLVSALDFRERETRYHSIRVALYAVELAKRLNVPERELKYVYWGGILHDIGKIGVPDKILLKPAKLTEEEWKIMRKHPEVGYVIVKDINFLKEANDIVLYHHEWWNGSGYPCGKKEHEIPFYARIFSVADAFDSMTSDRPYKKAISFEDADIEIQNGFGTQFDPEVVRVYFSVPSKLWERIKRTKPFRVEFPLPHLDKIHIED